MNYTIIGTIIVALVVGLFIFGRDVKDEFQRDKRVAAVGFFGFTAMSFVAGLVIGVLGSEAIGFFMPLRVVMTEHPISDFHSTRDKKSYTFNMTLPNGQKAEMTVSAKIVKVIPEDRPDELAIVHRRELLRGKHFALPPPPVKTYEVHVPKD